MTYLLDTTVLIDLLRNRHDRRAKLARLIEQEGDCCTTVINVAELYAGVRPQEEQGLRHLLATLRLYQITGEIAQRAGTLKNTSARVGITLALDDMLIAATAIHHQLVLVTDNRKDFPMPELRFYHLP